MFCQLKKISIAFNSLVPRRGEIEPQMANVKGLWRRSNATQILLCCLCPEENWSKSPRLIDVEGIPLMKVSKIARKNFQTGAAEKKPSPKSVKHIAQLCQTATLRHIMPEVSLFNPFIHNSLLWNELKTGCSQHNAVPEPLHSTKTGVLLHFCSVPQSSSSSVPKAATSAWFFCLLSSGVTCDEP